MSNGKFEYNENLEATSLPTDVRPPMRIVVVGDYCIDEYVYVDVTRISPEAPNAVGKFLYSERFPGMAGNVVANFSEMVGELGKDIELVVFGSHESIHPIVKTRYVDKKSGYILLRVDKNDYTEEFEKFDIQDFKSFAWDAIEVDAVVIADYNKGYLSAEDLTLIGEFTKEKGIPTILDTKKILNTFNSNSFSYIKINESERAKNLEVMSEDEFDNSCPTIIITKGKDGVEIQGHSRGCIGKIPTLEVEVSDVCGAGDVFSVAFTKSICKGDWLEKAIVEANVAAAYSVTKRGVTIVSKSELDEFRTAHQEEIDKIIRDINDQEDWVMYRGN